MVGLTLQEERTKRETAEFVAILRTMSESEKENLKGMMVASELYKKEIRDLNIEISRQQAVVQSVKDLLVQRKINEADALLRTV